MLPAAGSQPKRSICARRKDYPLVFSTSLAGKSCSGSAHDSAAYRSGRRPASVLISSWQCTARARPNDMRASLRRIQGRFPIASGNRDPFLETMCPSQNRLWSSHPQVRGRAKWTIRPRSIGRSSRPGRPQIASAPGTCVSASAKNSFGGTKVMQSLLRRPPMYSCTRCFAPT